MSNPSFEEHFGLIFRIENYFDENDTIPRIQIDIIDEGKRIRLQGQTSDFESLMLFISQQIDKANDREYIQ